MAVHITNVAKHIIRDSEEDKRAKEAGLSVYGTRDSGCAHLLLLNYNQNSHSPLER